MFKTGTTGELFKCDTSKIKVTIDTIDTTDTTDSSTPIATVDTTDSHSQTVVVSNLLFIAIFVHNLIPFLIPIIHEM